MELFFNIDWIKNGTDINDKTERVFQLEGKAFSAMEKEVKMMLGDANSNKLVWQKEMFQDKINALDEIKNIYSHLLTTNKKNEKVFKEAPHFERRMEELHKLKFYNMYRFLSSFVHPSPILREFTLLRSGFEKTPFQILESLFPELVENTLYFIFGILDDSDKILLCKFPDKKENFEKIKFSYFDMINEISNKF